MKEKSFDSLKQLINQLNSSLEELENGSLNVENINDFQHTASQVLERITWLKYKAMENSGAQKADQKELPEQKEKEEASSSQNKESPTFDFTEAFAERSNEQPKEQSKVNSFEQTKADESPTTEEEEGVDKNDQSQTNLLDAIGTNDSTINDALMKKGEDESLATQMQKKPLQDINDEIGMNDRFSYISEMFQEDSETYNQTIQKLNNLDNKIQAKEHLSELAVQYEWDLESKLVRKFVEIVERRYA